MVSYLFEEFQHFSARILSSNYRIGGQIWYYCVSSWRRWSKRMYPQTVHSPYTCNSSWPHWSSSALWRGTSGFSHWTEKGGTGLNPDHWHFYWKLYRVGNTEERSITSYKPDCLVQDGELKIWRTGKLMGTRVGAGANLASVPVLIGSLLPVLFAPRSK